MTGGQDRPWSRRAIRRPVRSLAPIVFPLAATLAGSAFPPAARANPGPGCIVFAHIHDPEGELCAGLPVQVCEEITSLTEQTGELAFDFILHWPWGEEDVYEFISDIAFTIRWPQDWQFLDAEVCGSGLTGVAASDSSATFSIEDLHGAPNTGPLFGLGRLVLSVASEGALSFTPSDHLGWVAVWGGARAGVQCGTCIGYDCAYHFDVRPTLDSRLLDLTAGDSGLATGSFHVGSQGWEYPPYANEYTFEIAEPWLSVDTVSQGTIYWPAYDVTVHADATFLDPGLHEGWIEIHAPWCYECVRVLFTVPGTIPPAVELETWGRLKARFR